MDADRDNVYEVSVNVTDGESTTSSNVTLTVTNMEEGIVSLSSLQPEVDVRLSATLSDPDGDVSDVSWLWEISQENTSEWRPISEAESDTYTPVEVDVGWYLRITASYTDGEGTDKCAQSTSYNVVREQHPPGHAPEFPDGETGLRSIAENAERGVNIGNPVAATDDEEHVLTYTLSGTDAASSDIVRSTGQLLTRAFLDHEAKSGYSMTMTVSDPSNAYDTISVTVDITNVEEEGALSLSTPQPHVDEELTSFLDDPDGGVMSVTWLWERSEDRMVWTGIDMADSDTYAPTEDDIDNYLRVTASYTDGEGSGKSAQEESFNPVHELEVNHAPTFLPIETGYREVPENTPEGTDIGGPFTAVDDHAHTLIQGDDDDSFDIDETTGQLRTKAPLGYESKSVYSVTVTVHDGEDAHGDSDHSSDATLAAVIIVLDVDESICVTSGAVADPTNAGLVSDCEALLVAGQALAVRPRLLNWSPSTSIEEWDGVRLGGETQRVTRLSIPYKGLGGTISPLLARLSMLTDLDLRSNDLRGPIPVELGDLSNLRVLNLHSNKLSGDIPNLSTTMLEELYLANNYDARFEGSGLTGPGPAWLNGMTDMRELWLWGNRLSGTIPDLSGITSLQKLKLASNNLTGGIPASLGLMSSLEWLVIKDNSLNGEIPAELARIHRTKACGKPSEEARGCSFESGIMVLKQQTDPRTRSTQ